MLLQEHKNLKVFFSSFITSLCLSYPGADNWPNIRAVGAGASGSATLWDFCFARNQPGQDSLWSSWVCACGALEVEEQWPTVARCMRSHLGVFSFVSNPSWHLSSLENWAVLQHDFASAY